MIKKRPTHIVIDIPDSSGEVTVMLRDEDNQIFSDTWFIPCSTMDADIKRFVKSTVAKHKIPVLDMRKLL